MAKSAEETKQEIIIILEMYLRAIETQRNKELNQGGVNLYLEGQYDTCKFLIEEFKKNTD